mmetsp:Transcript_7575/g.11993  ORF Transcript_7575/g.11993 Transcript_7575/m.11993 type:complete len:230 (-) Transcript_7575:850-1539(-)
MPASTWARPSSSFSHKTRFIRVISTEMIGRGSTALFGQRVALVTLVPPPNGIKHQLLHLAVFTKVTTSFSEAGQTTASGMRVISPDRRRKTSSWECPVPWRALSTADKENLFSNNSSNNSWSEGLKSESPQILGKENEDLNSFERSTLIPISISMNGSNLDIDLPHNPYLFPIIVTYWRPSLPILATKPESLNPQNPSLSLPFTFSLSNMSGVVDGIRASFFPGELNFV